MLIPDLATSDQERFATIKTELHARLPKTRPDSTEILRCAQLFSEVNQQGYHTLDNQADCPSWMKQRYGLGERQAEKYFSIARGYNAKDLEGRHLGLEILAEIAELPAELRKEALDLADRLGPSEHALRAGRMAIQSMIGRVLSRKKAAFRSAGLEEAKKRHEAAVTKAAQKEQSARQESQARRRNQETPGQRVIAGLASLAERVARLVAGKRGGLRGDEVAELRKAAQAILDSLGTQVPPPDPPPPDPPPPNPPPPNPPVQRLTEARVQPPRPTRPPRNEVIVRRQFSANLLMLVPSESEKTKLSKEITRYLRVPRSIQIESLFGNLIYSFRKCLDNGTLEKLTRRLCFMGRGDINDGDLCNVRELVEPALPGNPRREVLRFFSQLAAPYPDGAVFAIRFALAARLPQIKEYLERAGRRPLPDELYREFVSLRRLLPRFFSEVENPVAGEYLQ